MKPILEISAPGKAILCGEHAVVYGQDAIAFAIDLQCHCRVFREDNEKFIGLKIELILDKHLEEKQFEALFSEEILVLSGLWDGTEDNLDYEGLTDLEEFGQKYAEKFAESGRNLYVETTLYKILIYICLNRTSLQTIRNSLKKQYLVNFSSEIPISKGLGSSAAFNTTLSLFLELFFSSAESMQAFQISEQVKVSLNKVSFEFQKIEHGNPSGIDNFVSVWGGLVLFNKLKQPYFKLIKSQLIEQRLGKQLTIGFVDSQIQKNTKKAVQKVRSKYDLFLKGENQYKSMISRMGAFASLIIQTLSVSQNDCYKQKFLGIIRENHKLLCKFQLNNSAIDSIVQNYSHSDQIACKITGSGMGGVVLTVGDKTAIQKIQNLSADKRFVKCGINTEGVQFKLF